MPEPVNQAQQRPVGNLVFRLVAVLITAALALGFAPMTRAAAQEPTVTLLAAQGTAPVGQALTARAKVSPGAAGDTVFVEVWYVDRWVPIQHGQTNAIGEFTLPLSYGQGTAGTYRFRLGAEVNGETGYTQAFTVTRTSGTVTLMSAPGSLRVGTAGTARARISPAAARRTGFVEVWVGRWARIASATTNSTGDFTVPLSYGVAKAGSYTFRLGAVVNGATVHTRQFTVTRTAGTVTLMSAPGTLRVGTTGTARARISPAAARRTGFVEVWVGRWARIASATTNSTGDFTVPLSYGVAKAGSYTFRLGAVVNGTTVYTKQFTVTRTAAPAPKPAVYYANCTAVRNAGKAPLYRGEPGYASHLDRDGDGIACE